MPVQTRSMARRLMRITPRAAAAAFKEDTARIRRAEAEEQEMLERVAVQVLMNLRYCACAPVQEGPQRKQPRRACGRPASYREE